MVLQMPFMGYTHHSRPPFGERVIKKTFFAIKLTEPHSRSPKKVGRASRSVADPFTNKQPRRCGTFFGKENTFEHTQWAMHRGGVGATIGNPPCVAHQRE